MKNKISVISLFDGISCGQVALQRAGISVDKYYASEIESSAINITLKNFPDTIQIGDVTKIHYSAKTGILTCQNGEFYIGNVDLLIGGSPCTDFSSIGYACGMIGDSIELTTLEQYIKLKEEGAQFKGQSYLFWEFIRLLKEMKPQYFLLENVAMSKKWRNVIDTAIGVQAIQINSSLVSGQNRPRLYWTNIPNVSLPNDKHISIDDILSSSASNKDVSHCKTVAKSFDKLQKKYGYIPEKFNAYNASEISNKACALSRGSMVTSSCATLIFIPTENGIHTVKNGILNGKYNTKLDDGKYNIRRLSIKEMERLQTLPDDYTNVVNVSDQKRSAAIGNGWTVDAVAHVMSYMKGA